MWLCVALTYCVVVCRADLLCEYVKPTCRVVAFHPGLCGCAPRWSVVCGADLLCPVMSFS